MLPLIFYLNEVVGSATIQVPSAGNCGEDTVLTCQFTGNIEYTGWYGLKRSVMINGIPVRLEDSNKYTETRGQSSFTLTIHNTDIGDVGEYRCSNGFDASSQKRLNFECKATSATHSVTSGKKVQVTVDKLYPPSPTLTATFVRQNSTIQISGSRTCSKSEQYSGYYRCVWSSRNSIDDGSYTYSVVVTTITRASPLTGAFKIVSPELPSITNIVQLNGSREVLFGNEGQPLTIQCSSNGGYPVPTVTLYKDSISTSNQLAVSSSGTSQIGGTYTVNLQHTFTPETSDDRKYLICRSYYPQADSAKVGSKIKSVLLYLNLKPSRPTITQTSIVSAGNDVTVRCKTTECRPAASISWLYRGLKYNGSSISTLNATTETFTVISTYTRKVTAADNGQTIQCIVTHPALIISSEITASYKLSVNYPPSVSVNATNINVSVKASSVNLTCIVKGVPDSNYTYGKWIQRWPGLDDPVSERRGSEILVLTALTYEHSGYYTCTASNGIKVVDSNTYFVEGTALQLLVKSFPIIIRLDAKIASRLNKNLTFTIDYFSNVDGSDMKLYRNVNGVKKPTIIYSVTENQVYVELPVFSHLVKTKGIKAILTIQIKSEDDFGSYDVVVTNEIGSSNKSFEVLMTEPPSTPSGFTVDYIQYNTVRLSWKRGYNGGLPQTFVIQTGTDEKTWSDVEISDGIKQHENPISTILTDLQDSTTYFVRLYAYNNDGNSALSKTLNFTTAPIKVKVSVETNTTSTLIMGLVQGILNVALVIYAIYVTVLLKRRGVAKMKGEYSQPRQDLTKQTSGQTYANVDDSIKLEKTDAAKRRNSQRDDSTSQYTELDKELREAESAYDAISAI